jgi:hypothetical protein
MKAETAAIGRALAHAGYGTQFTGEDEGDFLADSPVENGHKPQPKKKPTQKPEDEAAAYQKKSDFHDKVYSVFPSYHPVTTLKAMGVDGLDNFANLSQAAALIKEYCYDKLFPVKVNYMRYVVTDTQKYLEFVNDPEPKLQHGLIRGYGRSSRIKTMLDGIYVNLYHELDLARYDEHSKGASEWVKMAQPLIIEYNEGNGFYTLTGIEFAEEDVEFV